MSSSLIAPHASLFERLWMRLLFIFALLVLLFLIAPILVIIPLSFNAEPYFSFTNQMLSLDPEGYSLRWYKQILTFGMANPDATGMAFLQDSWHNSQWIKAIKNSMIIAFWSTLLALALGVTASVGLAQSNMPAKRLIMALLISPMIVPLVIVAAGMFFFFSKVGLSQSYLGVILAHAVLGTPFVIITVTATLNGFDRSLVRAASNLGAAPMDVFFKVQMPLILPGVISGGLFAFITSFDEVVVVLFLAGPDQVTVPRQMWSGIREQISPTILAVATLLVLLSIALLATLEALRRRNVRMRGVKDI